jgi:hypothetical protein
MLAFYLAEVRRWNTFIKILHDTQDRQYKELYDIINGQWETLHYHTALLNNMQQRNSNLN